VLNSYPPPIILGVLREKVYNLTKRIMKTKNTPICPLDIFPLTGERKNRKAFTLVELIVVITILAIL